MPIVMMTLKHERPLPKFKPGDRVLYKNEKFNIVRSAGTVARFRSHTFINDRDSADGYCCAYAIIWDRYAHKEGAAKTGRQKERSSSCRLLPRMAKSKFVSLFH